MDSFWQWGRARALKEAYDARVRMSSPPDAERMIPLTIGDIFRWLEDEGFFHPARPKAQAEGATDEKKVIGHTADASVPMGAQSDAFCPACGIDLGSHITSMKQEITQTCQIFPRGEISRFPLVDVNASIEGNAHPPVTSVPGLMASVSWSSRRLLTAADPKVINAIRELVRPLNLPYFHNQPPDRSAGAPPSSHTDLEQALAPFALMSLSLRVFARKLLEGGAAAMKRDLSVAQSRVGRGGGRRGGSRRSEVQGVLAPAHVARQVQAMASRGGRLERALFLGVAELRRSVGLRVRPRLLSEQVTMGTGISVCGQSLVPGQGVQNMVKQEPDGD